MKCQKSNPSHLRTNIYGLGLGKTSSSTVNLVSLVHLDYLALRYNECFYQCKSYTTTALLIMRYSIYLTLHEMHSEAKYSVLLSSKWICYFTRSNFEDSTTKQLFHGTVLGLSIISGMKSLLVNLARILTILNYLIFPE